MGKGHPLRGYLFGAALAFTFWTFLGLLFTPQTYFANLPTNPSFSVWRAFAANAGLFYTWAVATPLVLWLGGRFPVARGRLSCGM